MAMTLAQAAYLSNDILQKGVITRLIYNDPILARLQFKDILGNGLTYNVETTLSTASFYGVNETWTESTSATTPTTATTTILGGDADVDNFLKATRSDVNDLMAEQIASKVRAIKHAFMNMFFYGYVTVDTKGFTGLHGLINSTVVTYPNTSPVGASTVPTVTLSMSDVEKAVDMVKVGKSDLMVMSKGMRRYINKYLRGVGGVTYQDAGQGRIQELFGIPVAISDEIADDERAVTDYGPASGTYEFGHAYTEGTVYTAGTTTGMATSIFILQFAPEAVCGIQTGGTITAVPVAGNLETKDATRTRIKWYPGVMLQNILTSSKVTGIATLTQTVAA
ncbi:MAG: hypothetical protein MUP49_05625 [Dehalococcoidia bacterium]|nr:hypothetical protein [Dehalococcoidia bacterium]